MQKEKSLAGATRFVVFCCLIVLEFESGLCDTISFIAAKQNIEDFSGWLKIWVQFEHFFQF